MLPDAEVLRHPLRLLPRRWRARWTLGCYAVHMVRTFGGSTPEVVSAQAKLRGPEIDRAMTAELRFAGGHTGRVRCSMWSTASAALQRQSGRRPRRAAAAIR